MRRFLLLPVLAVALLMAMCVPALADATVYDPATDIGSQVVYDLNMNGQKDPGEDGINGWLVELYDPVSGVKIGQSITATLYGYPGIYLFSPLAEGTYRIHLADGGGCWLRTYPAPLFDHIRTVPGTNFCNQGFGVVCQRHVKGYTMGFWSNKNGLAALQAYAPGGTITPAPYGEMTIAQIQAMANLANAVDMCDMLKAQYVAHWLNVNVKHANYAGAAVVIHGQAVDYDTELAAAIAFIQACLQNPGSCNREQAEEYKAFFDRLNNNRLPIVEYPGTCPLPSWPAW